MATNHHDTGYKELFSHPEFVQQLIEGFAPSEIGELMDFRTLTNHSGNYITPLAQAAFESAGSRDPPGSAEQFGGGQRYVGRESGESGKKRTA